MTSINQNLNLVSGLAEAEAAINRVNSTCVKYFGVKQGQENLRKMFLMES